MDQLAAIFMEHNGMSELAAKVEAAEIRDLIQEMSERGARLTEMLDAWFELTGLEARSPGDIFT